MRPNMVAYSKSSVKATNRLFDEAVSPSDLILFSVVDMSSERYEGEGLACSDLVSEWC